MWRFIILSLVFCLMASPVSAGQVVSVECQEKVCWTSQNVHADIQLSLVPGQSILETWQVSNNSDQSVKLLFKARDKASNPWADEPLQLAVNGQDLELEKWLEVVEVVGGESFDLQFQVRLDPQADNSWQNHIWQLSTEIMAVTDSQLEVTGGELDEKILGSGLPPESIKTQLTQSLSPWKIASVGLAIPLFLILIAYWFVRMRQELEEERE